MDTIDRISDLPPNITDHILQFVTLKDAVRTSVLSTQWRYKWTLSSQLVFDSSLFNSVEVESFYQNEEPCKLLGSLDALIIKFLTVVNNILLRHDGPIQKFVLRLPLWLPHKVDISHWIHFLSAKSVNQFTLRNSSHEIRKLPSWFFSCGGFTSLTHLTLTQFVIPSLPTMFSGFPFLVTLELRYMACDNRSGVANMVGNLVSNCPLLKTLDLLICDNEGRLNINAPRLQNLSVRGKLFGIFFKETKRIKTLSLGCQIHEELKFIGCFPLIEELYLGYAIFSELDTTIVGDCCFYHLKRAELCVGLGEIYLECIKNILSLSPVLEAMTIYLGTKDGFAVSNFSKKLLRYRRASTSAEIIFNHP